MKNSEIRVLDDEELELIELMKNLGMNTSMAKILVCIAISGETNSREIEIMTGIKPSTISTMLKKLRNDKVIITAKKQTGQNGRTVNFYSLMGTLDESLNKFIERKMSETSRYMEQIKKIKKHTRA